MKEIEHLTGGGCEHGGNMAVLVDPNSSRGKEIKDLIMPYVERGGGKK